MFKPLVRVAALRPRESRRSTGLSRRTAGSARRHGSGKAGSGSGRPSRFRTAPAPAAPRGEIYSEEFCCLFYGYPTQCLTCPLPKATLDLFELGGRFSAEGFAAHGKRANWERWNSQEQFGGLPGGDTGQGGLHDLDWCLVTLGLDAMPKSRTALKRAFQSMAKKMHPDVGGTAEGFRDLVKAYEQALLHFKR